MIDQNGLQRVYKRAWWVMYAVYGVTMGFKNWFNAAQLVVALACNSCIRDFGKNNNIDTNIGTRVLGQASQLKVACECT